MKKLLLPFACTILICSCSSTTENKRKIEQASKLIEYASNSPETEMNLPLGLELGWTEEKTKQYIDSLEQKDIVVSDSFPSFIYKYPKYKGLEANVELFFVDNSLYRMAFQHIYETEYASESTQEYRELLNYLFLDGSKRLEYRIPIDNIEDEENWDEVNLAVKDNMVVLFKRIKYDTFLQEEKVFIFSNQPKAKTFPEYKTKKEARLGEARFNEIKKTENWVKEHQSEIDAAIYRSTVKNSDNGSVWQVEEYLKRNLKDPDSYESIEWGTVTRNDNGYLVRHKYRAKNSFGGYVIESINFQLNTQGNVVQTLK